MSKTEWFFTAIGLALILLPDAIVGRFALNLAGLFVRWKGKIRK